MKNSSIVVIGATGRTGSLVVKELLNRGYTNITALSRSEQKLEMIGDKSITKVVTNPKAKNYTQNFTDADIIINCIGSDNLLAPIEFDVTNQVVETMKPTALYVVISAIGVGISWKNLTIRAKLFFGSAIRLVLNAKQKIEKLLEQGSVNYIIVRPGALVDADKDGVAVVKPAPSKLFGTISRKALAKIIVDLVGDKASYKKTWECIEIS